VFDDLRDYIGKVEEAGEYRLIEGADAGEEIGAITFLMSQSATAPLLMFDKINGYKAGYRVASNLFNTSRRTALGLGFALECKGIELVRAFREKMSDGIRPVPPVEVDSGPVKENILRGDKVDLLQFPAPKWHEHDGGPYIGTGSMVIARDPEEGWVNVSCYRVQVHDRNTVGLYVSPNHHLDAIMKKYWRKGLNCPIAISCGQEPGVWLGACWTVQWGVCEYDIAGWWRGQPVEVTKGVSTDLPIPATAEMVLEGEIVPPEVETRPEGPFGEYLGYYATGTVMRPACRIKSILHRKDPIIQGMPPSRFSSEWSLGRYVHRAATIWSELDKQITGVMGVWAYEAIGAPCIVVISVRQGYAGHAKQAALLTCGLQCVALFLRYVIVVDDDIDPSNIGEVLWALGTRADPAESINIVTGQLSSYLDPSVSPEKRKRGDTTTSTAIVLAVRPYHWMADFPQPIAISSELSEKIKKKWKNLFPAA
jgi:UbiD family decarboxylase